MSNFIGMNVINVSPGDPCFVFGGNLCQHFEIGREGVTSYRLIAQIVGSWEDPEFLFNGLLYAPMISEHGTIIDNFPKGPAPSGWVKRIRPGREGYDPLRYQLG